MYVWISGITTGFFSFLSSSFSLSWVPPSLYHYLPTYLGRQLVFFSLTHACSSKGYTHKYK